MANRPDPEAVGLFLLGSRQNYPDKFTFAELADNIPWHRMPQMQSTSMVQETVRTYITELEAQAVAGVKSSKRALVRLGYWHTCDVPTCDEPIPYQVLTCEKHRPGFGSSELHTPSSAEFFDTHPAKKMNHAFIDDSGIDKNGDAVHPLSSTLTEDDDALN